MVIIVKLLKNYIIPNFYLQTIFRLYPYSPSSLLLQNEFQSPTFLWFVFDVMVNVLNCVQDVGICH